MPGVSIKYDLLVPLVRRAVDRGFVSERHGEFVLRGLWFGFDLGIDVTKLKGRRWFRNYASAEEHRDQVTAAVRERVQGHKAAVGE